MLILENRHSRQRGLGMRPHLRSREVRHSLFSENVFSLFGENLCQTFAVKVADFARKTMQGGVVCFDVPVPECQNRYWVNTIRSVMTGRFSHISGSEIYHFEKKEDERIEENEHSTK